MYVQHAVHTSTKQVGCIRKPFADTAEGNVIEHAYREMEISLKEPKAINSSIFIRDSHFLTIYASLDSLTHDALTRGPLPV